MSFSDASDCSDGSELGFPGETVYSLDELQEMEIIDDVVVEWIKENPLPEDDPLLLLEYLDQDIANRSNKISDALKNNGGTPVTSTVFQFATRDEVNLAQKSMRNTHTWAFYHPDGIAAPGYLLDKPDSWVPLRQDQTISNILIHYYSDSKFTLEREFRFFEF